MSVVCYPATKMTNTKLRKLGFCGADDSISPRALALIFNSYPFVEFGVLFRPDKVRYSQERMLKRQNYLLII